MVGEQFHHGRFGKDPQHGIGVAEFDGVGLLEGHDPLLQGTDHLQAGAVTHVCEPGILVPAEVALTDPALGGAVEQGTPVLELEDAFGGLTGVEFGHTGVVEEFATADGVTKVHGPLVGGVDVAQRRCSSALGHDRVGLAEQ